MKLTKVLNKTNDDSTRGGTTKRRVFIATLLLLSGLLYWWHYNPLPSDEEMIDHFQEHRTEIEELVKRYRACVEKVGTGCEWLSENQSLMEKARIKRVKDIAPIWPPNPYSQEAAKQFDDSLLAGKIPSLNPYSSISIELLDEDDPRRHFGMVLTSSGVHLIFKDLVFMPEIARIEGGNLWLPAHPLLGVNAKMRTFSSLDTYPPDWIRGECVYRQFETHWFIRLCTAAV